MAKDNGIPEDVPGVAEGTVKHTSLAKIADPNQAKVAVLSTDLGLGHIGAVRIEACQHTQLFA